MSDSAIVAGYSGITASGAGYTGAAAVTGSTGGASTAPQVDHQRVGYEGVVAAGPPVIGNLDVGFLPVVGQLGANTTSRSAPPVSVDDSRVPSAPQGGPSLYDSALIPPWPGRSRAGAAALFGSAEELEPTINTTGPEDRPPWWPAATNGISFELQSAWELPPPSGVVAELPLPQTQVLSWLQHHRQEIISAELKFGVDRRAIAGAIAWEALENSRTASIRAVGPGKVHVNADVVTEIETSGYLPERSSSERSVLLRQPGPAIEYVAAIMSAKANIAEELGFPSIRNRPDLLAQEYVARSLQEWRDLLAEKTSKEFVVAEDMGLWTGRHLPYLERGVGRPTSGVLERRGHR